MIAITSRIRIAWLGLLGGLWLFHAAPAQAATPGFELIALGVQGGLIDGDLSAWLLRSDDDQHYLGLDAGTELSGINQALQRHAFDHFQRAPNSPWSPVGQIFRDGISAYFISHPHLDHVAGLLIGATDDNSKPIYGLATTLDALQRDYFNWSAWPNFADRGVAPALGRYQLQAQPPRQWFAIAGTRLQGQLFELQHDRMTSSMLLLRRDDQYLAYFGDTGPDQPQASTDLATIWSSLAPLIRRQQLRGLVIETSYPNGIDDAHLYGHLTPAWLLFELHRLAAAVGGRQPLADLPVIVTHIKPSLRADTDPRAAIMQQLQQGNDLGLRLLFPQQGQRLWLPAPAHSE